MTFLGFKIHIVQNDTEQSETLKCCRRTWVFVPWFIQQYRLRLLFVIFPAHHTESILTLSASPPPVWFSSWSFSALYLTVSRRLLHASPCCLVLPLPWSLSLTFFPSALLSPMSWKTHLSNSSSHHVSSSSVAKYKVLWSKQVFSASPCRAVWLLAVRARSAMVKATAVECHCLCDGAA